MKINTKKISGAILLITASILIIIGCSRKDSQQKQKIAVTTDTSLFQKGQKLSNEWFSGNAFLQPLLARDKNNNFALGSVTFEAGARTHWHTHPKGQVLIVTEGQGLYQEKGKPARLIKKGDVINIPENIEHWHGATASTNMVHVAITNFSGNENVKWLKAVTAEEYNQANN